MTGGPVDRRRRTDRRSGYRRPSVCRKVAYPDALGARIALASVQARGRAECRTYQCPRCHGWHLTSQRSGA